MSSMSGLDVHLFGGREPNSTLKKKERASVSLITSLKIFTFTLWGSRPERNAVGDKATLHSTSGLER